MINERTEPCPLIFEKSRPGASAVEFPSEPEHFPLPGRLKRKRSPRLPELSELDVVRHFTRLSTRNVGVDTMFYPLGSCTMKYNPKVNEKLAGHEGVTRAHPLQPVEDLQGFLQLLYETERMLSELSGFPAISLQPAAGAHGEFTSLLVVRAHFRKLGQHRDVVLIPDTAHGTNPASCTFGGFKTRVVKSDATGLVDLADLKTRLGPDTACLMLTNPNTLGVFEENILEVARLVHGAGAILYLDGANFNAIMGITRPADFGVDVMHFNLHKSFSTPHGGGGPGSGPIGVTEVLEPFLPVPRIKKTASGFAWEHACPDSVGKVHGFYGNAGVVVRAYAYLRRCGRDGVKKAAEMAVLNANYLAALLSKTYPLATLRRPLHEFVLSGGALARETGIRTRDVAKALIDRGFHPPTIYFPLLVPEAMMIEPTESENKETLDRFAAALIDIVREAREHPDKLHQAPQFQPVGRLDEVKAARDPRLSAATFCACS